MSIAAQDIPFTPSSVVPEPQDSNLALPSLPALVGALSGQPELDIITATVAQYVAQRHAYYVSSAIRPKDQSQLSPPSFEVSTLLQAFAWEHLDALDEVILSSENVRTLRDQLLESPEARHLGMKLHNALGWNNDISAQQADLRLLKLLVWTALILEIESPASRKPGHIASYDLTAENNWGQPYDQLRANIVEHLQWHTRTVEGNRSSSAARLALAILEPIHAEFAVRDIPKDLNYGTLRWVNFAHGTALAQRLEPGNSPLQTFDELADLPFKRSNHASEENLEIIAETRLLPTVQWAIAHGVINHRQHADYPEADICKAVTALDEHSVRLSAAMQAVLRDAPNRLDMAKQRFTALVGDHHYLREMIMMPTTVWKQLEFVSRHPRLLAPGFNFFLLDVFTAGFMKNGMDLFKPDLSTQPYRFFRVVIEKLKGVDIPAEFDDAFNAYFDEARGGYAVLIESLFEQLPSADRVCLNEGEVKIYAVRCETGKTASSETDQDRADSAGRFGFVIQCSHLGHFFSYECFAFQSRMVRRTDLAPLGVPASYARRPPGSSYIRQVGTSIGVDWLAYSENREPAEGAVSGVIPVEIGHFNAGQTSADHSCHALRSPRLKLIADLITQRNMFCDYYRTYRFNRGKTGSELVSENYPPVLQVYGAVVPGLSCFNAIQNNESPVPTCILDAASFIALPLFKLVKGSLNIVLRAGRIHSVQALTGFAKWIGRPGSVRLKNSLPLMRMPQRINGRIGYPLSGRGAGTSRSRPLSPRKLDSVEDFDDVVTRTDIFRNKEQVRLDMRASLSEGAEMRVHVRRDGTRTLVKKDTIDGSYIDLSNNETVRMVSHYDHRVLKSWAVENESTMTNVIRVRLDQVESTRVVLEPARLNSVKEAIEAGTYLPPLDVRKAGTRWAVINGNHRLQAALKLGLDEIPVIIHL